MARSLKHTELYSLPKDIHMLKVYPTSDSYANIFMVPMPSFLWLDRRVVWA